MDSNDGYYRMLIINWEWLTVPPFLDPGNQMPSIPNGKRSIFVFIRDG